MTDIVIAAGYIRVSTKEQSLKGLSLEAQEAEIREYCARKGYKLSDLYIDRGITARKSLYKRERFMDMMRDAQAKKINHIVILRLDRFFRNVYDYHRMMNEFLIPNGVSWSAVKEEYDTTTTNGRLMINLRLAIAEQECDQDSDRIKDVFANRIKDGYVVYGVPPKGYKIESKRFVPNEDAEMIRDAFESYLRLSSTGKVMQYINQKYGTHIDYTEMSRLLKKEIYIGKYRDNESFCEPIVSKDVFNAVQRGRGMNVRDRKTHNTYIFGGLLLCSKCGHRLTGHLCRGHKYYRCSNAFQNKVCTNFLYVREDEIEQYLVSHAEMLLQDYIIEIRANEKSAPKPKVNKEQINKKIERLNELFINDLISLEELKKKKADLEAQLVPEEKPKTDLSAVQAFLNSGFRQVYDDLSDEEKQSLWRSVIKEIVIKDKQVDSVTFL